MNGLIVTVNRNSWVIGDGWDKANKGRSDKPKQITNYSCFATSFIINLLNCLMVPNCTNYRNQNKV